MATGKSNDIRPAAAVVLHRGNKIWLGQRGRVRFLPGFSVFPGGASETGESFQDTAIRELKEETGLICSASALQPFSRAITPPYSNYRFDVRVFSLELSDSQEPQPDGYELVSGNWYTAEEALRKRDSGLLQLAPPTWRQLQQWQSKERWTDKAFSQPPPRNERVLPMSKSLVLVPLKTRTLPPTHWTNTILLGSEDFFVVDPGGPEQETLKEEIEAREQRGHELKGVLLTHHHQDHLEGYHQVGGGNLPLFCHSATSELLPPGFPVPTLLEDGQLIRLGPGYTIEVVFTPGHAPGHIALFIPEEKALIAGDMISSLSSVVIPEDTGNLADYLDSLKRLRELEANLVIPGHGPPFGKDSDPFGTALAHRKKREEQVIHALAQSTGEVDDIVKLIYGNLDPILAKAARGNVKHYLEKLKLEERVSQAETGWSLNLDARK